MAHDLISSSFSEKLRNTSCSHLETEFRHGMKKRARDAISSGTPANREPICLMHLTKWLSRIRTSHGQRELSWHAPSRNQWSWLADKKQQHGRAAPGRFIEAWQTASLLSKRAPARACHPRVAEDDSSGCSHSHHDNAAANPAPDGGMDLRGRAMGAFQLAVMMWWRRSWFSAGG